MKSPLEKLNEMAEGKRVICSDADLDAMLPFDRANFVRSIPNKGQVGTKDQWECWIEYRDIQKLKGLS